ncbi:sensor histidine kinase [Crocosphaera sp. XPORK-15E]|uniref:sensor histidine kinase n=1 Tax=Crocosphaera sp. XPORK-15E TaxID=3110247 RepID=UPI002B218CA9|nr:ATP-binding protein [Crocosphaera sp. XPORK-15E]MEA5537332.1 ATP-binding protein [Crocosphaera sp. XPORK-15E]
MTSDLGKENERLKKLLMAKERLAFLGKISPFLRHKLVNEYCWIRTNLDFIEKALEEQEQALQLMRAMVDDEQYSEDEVDESLEKFYDAKNKIKGSIQSIRELVKSCLSLGEPYLPFTINEISDISVGFELFDFNKFLENCCFLSRSNFREKDFNNPLKVNLIINFSENLPLFWGVQSSLRLVFMNLIDNAYEAIEEKYKNHQFLDETPKISVETIYKKDWIVVKIKDNGIGIEPQLLEKIFEPFFSTKKKYVQAGAGLTLSKNLLKTDYNATIEASLIAGFTTFTVKFPLVCSLEAHQELIDGESQRI